MTDKLQQITKYRLGFSRIAFQKHPWLFLIYFPVGIIDQPPNVKYSFMKVIFIHIRNIFFPGFVDFYPVRPGKFIKSEIPDLIPCYKSMNAVNKIAEVICKVRVVTFDK